METAKLADHLHALKNAQSATLIAAKVARDAHKDLPARCIPERGALREAATSATIAAGALADAITLIKLL